MIGCYVNLYYTCALHSICSLSNNFSFDTIKSAITVVAIQLQVMMFCVIYIVELSGNMESATTPNDTMVTN